MNDWTWEYEGYDPAQERLRESLCTVGNGYFATRGAAPECRADEVHYPGTYAAGCYDRLTSTVAGRQVGNEDLVNLPNWLPLRFRLPTVDDPAPAWITPDTHRVLEQRLTLDLRSGILERTVSYDVAGLVLHVRQCRLAHMEQPHVGLLSTRFAAEGGSGDLEVESALDGTVTNSGVERYRSLAERHLTTVRTGQAAPDTCWLACRTASSGIQVALAVRTAGAGAVERRTVRDDARVAQRLRFRLAPGTPVTVDKTLVLYTSRDRAISDPVSAANELLVRTPPAEELMAGQRGAWRRLWANAAVDVPGDAGAVLRLHLFHVLQTLSPQTAELDAGVPARGLTGEAYRGHVFWDELFVLPYLNLHFPQVSRALLDYRHRRLDRACADARAAGRRGAQYPWQSGSDGGEDTQELHLNPRSGHWLPDRSRLQHHVGLAVAYNVLQYHEATGDTGYLHTKGAEMLLQIARYWAALAEHDPVTGRYHVRGVVGPDEYHDAYPDEGRPGIDDNAYTNVMAAWVISRTLGALGTLPTPLAVELRERTGLDAAELDHWDTVSRQLYVPFHAGVISQFTGYGDLAELDWDAYRARYGSIRRLDRILEAEGDDVNRYQASKQADVLMLGYLLNPVELGTVFHRLGHRLDADTWQRTVDYYLRRTSHGSTLSSLVHAWTLARARRSEAWTFAREALAGDIADLQGGTTGEGIHLGAMAGTLDLLQRGLTGLEPRGGALRLDPVPVPHLSAYGFSIRYRGHWGIRLEVRSGRLRITVPASDAAPISVELPDRTVSVHPGETCTLALPDA
ncbi:glycoside hydrolase family 65 protein [Streptomyces sp. NPDC020412]|uniref:glycoside hydrolase family 65 protein n=1 Tax=Streptomyces sp. NPDC020412 TaxID=3365073 RepID=UPI0037975EE3